jgi:competence protein ComEA
MFKKLLATLLALFAAAAFAAVDANKATQAELESIKGIGPAIAGKILDERKKGAFKDWNDMVERVKGVGEGNAAKFSAEGLTVNGATFKGAAAAPATMKKEDKPAAAAAAPAPAPKMEEKKAPVATAPVTATAPAAATAAKAEAKAGEKKSADKPAMTADDKKAAAKKEKEEKAAAKAKAKEEKAAAAKKAKDDKPAAAAKAADAKASEAKAVKK